MLQATCWHRGHHVAAHRGLQATRLLTDWRMLAAGGAWFPSKPLRSFPAHRRFLQSQRYLDRIFWQGIKDEADPLRPLRPGRQCLEVVELIFGSANVRTLLPAERSAASRAGPPAMTKRRVDLADQLHQAGISIVGIQETRCRGQVTGSCRGFGAADKAGCGGVELWTRQDIMGYPRSFHVLVAEPRFLLVKGHRSIQFCVCHGPDSTRDQAEIQAWWRRSAALIWSACLVSLPLVVLCDANARVGSVASLAVGDQAPDWEDTAGAEFHALLREWDLCLPATLPGPHNDPAKPSGTWCSRTRWRRIDFVAVPRDWFAGVKRAEVETAVALLGSESFDRVAFTSVQEVLTLLARLCGDLRFASG